MFFIRKKVDSRKLSGTIVGRQMKRVYYSTIPIHIDTYGPFVFKLLYSFHIHWEREKFGTSILHGTKGILICFTPPPHILAFIQGCCHNTPEKAFIITTLCYADADLCSFQFQRKTCALSTTQKHCESIHS